jgi:delta 1-pyrroline-5-carboxylate dehydrogenase
VQFLLLSSVTFNRPLCAFFIVLGLLSWYLSVHISVRESLPLKTAARALSAGKGSEIGDFLTTHPSVNCISFTGGDTGISISHKAGMVPLQMELGGKDACIVCSDADLDLAASHIVKGGFSYSGQRCTAVKVRMVLNGCEYSLQARCWCLSCSNSMNIRQLLSALYCTVQQHAPTLCPIFSIYSCLLPQFVVRLFAEAAAADVAAAGCCGCFVQVVLAMQDIADELVAKVKAGVAKLTVGRPEDNADITPVVSEASANFIQVRMFGSGSSNGNSN